MKQLYGVTTKKDLIESRNFWQKMGKLIGMIYFAVMVIGIFLMSAGICVDKVHDFFTIESEEYHKPHKKYRDVIEKD